jgi:DNA (cytosine-5)-methyltransferase 1
VKADSNRGQKRCVELFSGAGGLALGLEQAGFKHVALIERNPFATATLLANQNAGVGLGADCQVISGDVRGIRYREIAEGIDLVAGGPPCQPFSMGGKAQGMSDSRDMWPEAVRAIRELLPQAFIFENVRGLLRPVFRNYVEYVRLQLRHPEFPTSDNVDWETNLRRLQRHDSAGAGVAGVRYNVFIHSANAADFGVPQKRHRVFFVGFRSDIRANWSFPKRTHSEEALQVDKFLTSSYWERNNVRRKDRELLSLSDEMRVRQLTEDLDLDVSLKPWKTTREALAGLPEPTSSPSQQFFNHVLQTGARSYPGHTGSPLDEPAKALKAGDHGVPGGENMLVRPDGTIRYFTVRESGRIQTFPDEWRFTGSWTEAMRQVGNAVPVELARLVGESVMNALADRRTHTAIMRA